MSTELVKRYYGITDDPAVWELRAFVWVERVCWWAFFCSPHSPDRREMLDNAIEAMRECQENARWYASPTYQEIFSPTTREIDTEWRSETEGNRELGDEVMR